MISSSGSEPASVPSLVCFNLVIEVLLISRLVTGNSKTRFILAFQSRNRGSFDFKGIYDVSASVERKVFQSRNRGSFDFKFHTCLAGHDWEDEAELAEKRQVSIS